MAGEIALESPPAGGSVFSFVLDLPVSLALPGAVTDAPRDLSGRAVLIVAPEGAEPRVLQRKLIQHGADARIAATAFEAAALVGAAAAAGQPYAALLVDGRAESQPAAVLSRVREAAGGRVPAAVVIEPGKRRDVEALRAAGFDAYLVRPVRGASLLRIVRDIATATGDDFRVDPGDVAPRASSAQRTFGAHLRVLLAEDNEINALLARAVLERLGHTVDEVHDGAAAVAAATAAGQPYGLILMDLHMPGLDGLAAVRAIRAHERDIAAERTRILAVTADVLAETRAAALAAGVDQVVEKPMTPESLRRALAVVAGAAA
jgi:CheY-like chemotaxis protein